MKSPACLNTAFLALILAAAPAGADDISDQIETARKAYEAGELRSAVQTLQFAVASIQERINLSLLDLLPAPLEGWSADEPEAQAGGIAAMITGTSLSRRYHREDGAQVEISITADSPLLSMMGMMLANPMLLQSSPGARTFTHAGHRGMVREDADRRGWEISLMVGANVLVQVTGSGLEERQAVDDYLAAIDLPAVQRAFGA